MPSLRSAVPLAAIALAAIAAWPALQFHPVSASRVYVAPVLPDYRYRDRTIAFYERRVNNDARDQVSAQMLAAQYMQRYRENQDIGDIMRAIHQARRALVLQPQNNAGSAEVIASGYTALHQFGPALRFERAAYRALPIGSNAPAQMASLEMELGDYAAAARDLRIAMRIRSTPTVMAVQGRYDELTGRMNEARRLLQAAAAQTDAIADNPAQARAWYHFRLGELAFSQGALAQAEQDERDALAEFPSFELAYRALARFCWASKDWRCALEAAMNAANIAPIPESLGYQADAQAALGDRAGAAQTRALIFAVERIGNAYRLNDRLLSVYFAEHRTHLDDALRIAQREAGLRGKEIYAQDTLAWAAAMNGRWTLADRAMRLAIRFDTQDPRIQFHAGMIDYHFGRFSAARRHLQHALALNPQFDPFYADQARKVLLLIH